MGLDSLFEPSPFSAPIDFGSALRALDFLARPNPAASSTVGGAPATSSSVASAARAGDPALPTPAGAAAVAPSPAIAPVFTEANSRTRTFDAASIRNDFPILRERVHGKRLIWLDNGATTQKPQAVIDRLAAFYTHENSNVHRAAHTLAARASDAYEAARDKVRRFVNASSPREIVFVRGATEGINLVAQSWGRRNVKAGDEIVVTWLEHHANIVPWQQLCRETGARLRVAPVDDNGDVMLDEYEKLLGPRTRIVALTMVSNALGTVTPAREMIEAAHRHGALTLVDGAQSVAHQRTDVQALDADFFVLSGHKMFAPTGIGVVYGKQAILETMPPWQGGGAMIADVTFERTVYQSPPDRFEAGTGNIADAVGLGAAIDYLDAIGMEAIARYEHDLIAETVAGLGAIPGLRLVGRAAATGRRRLLCARRLPHRGCWKSVGPGGHRRSRGPPLRAADPAPLRAREFGAAVVRALQHARRCRGFDRCGAPHRASGSGIFAPLKAPAVTRRRRRDTRSVAATRLDST